MVGSSFKLVKIKQQQSEEFKRLESNKRVIDNALVDTIIEEDDEYFQGTELAVEAEVAALSESIE